MSWLNAGRRAGCSEIVTPREVLKRNDCSGGNVMRLLKFFSPQRAVCSRRGTRASQLPRTRRNLGPAPPQSLPPTIPLFSCFAILTGTLTEKNLVPRLICKHLDGLLGKPMNTADHALYNRPCTPVGTDSRYARFLAPGKRRKQDFQFHGVHLSTCLFC